MLHGLPVSYCAGITATVVINTLVMAVFERTREIGILAAIGMKGGRIMAMFLAEAPCLPRRRHRRVDPRRCLRLPTSPCTEFIIGDMA